MTESKLSHSPQSSTIILIVSVILLGISRYLPLEHPWLFNFSPSLAIFLFCGAYFRRCSAWITPLFAIIVSDLFLNPTYGISFFEPFMVVTTATYLLIWIIGKKIGSQRTLTAWALSAVSVALLFHILTCSFAWAYNPAYPKSIFGFVQAIFIGEPGYAPSYLFLRNSVLGTLFFSISLRWLHSFSSNRVYLWDLISQKFKLGKNAVFEPQKGKYL